MTLENGMMLLCGLGFFLFGMKLMGDGLELTAGSRLKSLVERLTTNKYMGALVGLLVTAVIQSSSATTVMVVGFVNAGIMNLAQAVGVIMGANIGTTVTSFLIAIKLNALAPLAIFLGVILMQFSKKVNRRHVGQIITGFGVLFYGMSVMSSSMEPLSESEFFRNAIVQLRNPILGLLVGLVFTAIIQSSSASVGVLQALALSGAIGLDSAIFVIYGQNIGTCVTALLSCIGTTKTAKRTAMVHLLFNIIGAILFTILTLCLPIVSWIEALAPGNVVMQISLIHIIFNVVMTSILLPMSNVLVKLACRMVPGEDSKREAMSLSFLDPRILSTPPIAVTQVIKEVERMAHLAETNFQNAMDALFTKDESKVQELKENEGIINFLNQNITEYLVKINALELEENDRKVINALFHVVSDYERIGDHSENIGEEAEIIIGGKASLSEAALEELDRMRELVLQILEDSMQLFLKGSGDTQLAFNVNATEEVIDNETDRLKEKHIERLNQGLCTALAGSVYTDALTNLERIADHATNIAFSMENTKHKPVLAYPAFAENTEA